ncbi:hypothetical protein OG426_19455 [Streptomyces canus]|uniref:hypothetical protein n=1 Tax=Streptomyces canus TaxID=58343 RepID=UPI00224FA39D|nr:hypothetical protein [Streptomyces canus]MCX4858952.1 hypothetical protein [Streptomyces canus]WSW34509.1 hypothetical protein OG426_19455 [Streptomyces canus]
MAEKQPSAWQRVLAARAMGQEVDPADIDEARAASRPGTVGWAAKVAARAVTKRVPAPEGPDRFRAAVLARLAPDDNEGGPTAA